MKTTLLSRCSQRLLLLAASLFPTITPDGLLPAAEPLGFTLAGSWPGGLRGSPNGITVVDNYAFLAVGPAGIAVFDVTDPTQPVQIGALNTPGDGAGIAVANSYAVVADGTVGLQMLDVRNLAQPTLVGTLSTSKDFRHVALAGTLAYVTGFSGFYTVDVSDPAHPAQLGAVETSLCPGAAQVVGQHAYLADGCVGLQILDVSNPAQPAIVGKLPSETSFYGDAVRVRDGKAYVTSGSKGLVIVDVSDPTAPTRLGALAMPDLSFDVQLNGPYALVADYRSGVQIIDVSNPAQPTIAGAISTGGEAVALQVVGRYAYVADRKLGLVVVDVNDPSKPAVVGAAAFPAGGYTSDVELRGSTVFLADRESFRVFDATEPSALKTLGSLSRNTSFYWQTEIAGDFAYVTDGAGIGELSIFDVREPAEPKVLGRYKPLGGAPFVDVAVAGDYAWLAVGSRGVEVVQVRDPAKPVRIASLDTPGYGDAVLVEGPYAYLADGSGGLQVLQFTPGSLNIGRLGGLDTPGNAVDVQVVGTLAYIADGPAGLQIIDVTDPRAPAARGSQATGDSALDVEVAGNYVFVATGASGVQILDASDPAAPVRIGSLDTPGYARKLRISGSRLFVADGEGGLLIYDLVPSRPFVTQQPQNLRVAVGEQAVLSAAALGDEPLTYQWRKDGVALVDGGRISVATTATLRVGDTRFADQGSYTILVSNAAGAATSNPATLVVQPRIAPSVKWSRSKFELTFTAEAGRKYRVQGSTDFQSWRDLRTITGAGRMETYSDFGAGTVPKRFYRLASP